MKMTETTPPTAGSGDLELRPGRPIALRAGGLMAPAWLLAWLGALLFVIYAGLGWRFSLAAHQGQPFLDFGKLTAHQPLQGVVVFLAFAVAFGGYWVGYLQLRIEGDPASPAAWKLVIGWAVAFSLAFLLMYPVGAADVFDNIIRGRMTALYHANPFIQVPNQFPNDPFLRYAAWGGAHTAYGPLWELLAAVLVRLAGNGIAANVLVFKVAMILTYAADVALIRRILLRIAPQHALAGVYLFAWNPPVLFEIAGNAHNDGLMLMTILLAVYFYVTRRYATALVALVAGALVKFLPAALIPLFLVGALRRLPPGRRWSFLVAGGMMSLGLVLAIYAPVWGSSDPLNLAHRESLFTTSLPALMEIALESRMGGEAAGRIINAAGAALLGLFVLYQTWRLDTDDRSLIRSTWAVLMFYLLVPVPWLQPWYIVWPLGLAALLDDALIVGGTVLFSYTLLWKYFLFNFIFGAMRLFPDRAPRELVAVLVVLPLPVMYYVDAIWKRRRGLPAETPERQYT